MATATSSPLTASSPPTVPEWSAADLLDRFGPIPLWRVRLTPAPGAATEQDVLDIHEREKRLCELIDGVLVEKTVGMRESFLAALIIKLIGYYVDQNHSGLVLSSDGMVRLAPGLIRIPDVSYIAWERFPGRIVPAEAYVNFGPDLAVEVLSPSNTAKEMEQKLVDYFTAGVRLVWYVDPVKRTVEVFTAVGQSVVLREGQSLDGGDVLPGFSLPLTTLFAELGPALQ